MSAFTPNSGHQAGRRCDVRFVPKAVISRLIWPPCPLWREARVHGWVERLYSVEIDYEFEFGGLENWQVGWLGTPKYAARIDTGYPRHFGPCLWLATLQCRRPQQEVGIHHALALDVERAARLERVGAAQDVARLRGDMDLPWRAECLHAACGVHRVAPDVVDEFVRADDAGDYWASVDADPRLQIDLQRTCGANS